MSSYKQVPSKEKAWDFLIDIEEEHVADTNGKMSWRVVGMMAVHINDGIHYPQAFANYHLNLLELCCSG